MLGSLLVILGLLLIAYVCLVAKQMSGDAFEMLFLWGVFLVILGGIVIAFPYWHANTQAQVDACVRSGGVPSVDRGIVYCGHP